MPFKSQAQWGKFSAMESRGEIPKGTTREWAHKTRTAFGDLPKKKRRGKKRRHTGRKVLDAYLSTKDEPS